MRYLRCVRYLLAAICLMGGVVGCGHEPGPSEGRPGSGRGGPPSMPPASPKATGAVYRIGRTIYFVNRGCGGFGILSVSSVHGSWVAFTDPTDAIDRNLKDRSTRTRWSVKVDEFVNAYPLGQLDDLHRSDGGPWLLDSDVSGAVRLTESAIAQTISVVEFRLEDLRNGVAITSQGQPIPVTELGKIGLCSARPDHKTEDLFR